MASPQPLSSLPLPQAPASTAGSEFSSSPPLPAPRPPHSSSPRPPAAILTLWPSAATGFRSPASFSLPHNRISAPSLSTVPALPRSSRSQISLQRQPTSPPQPSPATSSSATRRPGGPSCGGPFAPNASCYLQIAYVPTATGPANGTLTIASATVTATAALSGFGSPDPGLSINPTALNFRNVPGPTATQQTITLANTGLYNLQIAIPTSSSASFQSSTTCSALVPGCHLHDHDYFHPDERHRQRHALHSGHQFYAGKSANHLHCLAQRRLHQRGHRSPDSSFASQLWPHRHLHRRPHSPVPHQ